MIGKFSEGGGERSGLVWLAGSSAGANHQGSYLARGDTENNQIIDGGPWREALAT